MDDMMGGGSMPPDAGGGGTKRSFASMLNEGTQKAFPGPKAGRKPPKKGVWDKMRDYASKAEAESYHVQPKRRGY